MVCSFAFAPKNIDEYFPGRPQIRSDHAEASPSLQLNLELPISVLRSLAETVSRSDVYPDFLSSLM
tara:strand:- start:152 stop:349 length:198 start_codon:yes stop_codon:yes gene_type:complete